MGVSYTIDSERQLVITRVVGIVDGAQLQEHQRKLGRDPEFNPAMRELMDCLELQDANLKSIVKASLASSSPWGVDARRAVVVSSALAFGLLRIFKTVMGDAHGEISIFRDMGAAKVWLGL